MPRLLIPSFSTWQRLIHYEKANKSGQSNLYVRPLEVLLQYTKNIPNPEFEPSVNQLRCNDGHRRAMMINVATFSITL